MLLCVGMYVQCLSVHSQLMHPDYHKRMSNLDTLRQHPLYASWDFVQVQSMEVAPTFVPPVSEDVCVCVCVCDCEDVIVTGVRITVVVTV